MECVKKYINAVIMPFNYLFYKLYVFYLVISSGDSPSGMSHLGVMGALIACNIITLSLTVWGYFPPIWIYAISFLIIIPYAFSKVAEKIVSKYENEQENSRIIGNIVVVIYIILSVVSLILVL